MFIYALSYLHACLFMRWLIYVLSYLHTCLFMRLFIYALSYLCACFFMRFYIIICDVYLRVHTPFRRSYPVYAFIPCLLRYISRLLTCLYEHTLLISTGTTLYFGVAYQMKVFCLSLWPSVCVKSLSKLILAGVPAFGFK